MTGINNSKIITYDPAKWDQYRNHIGIIEAAVWSHAKHKKLAYSAGLLIHMFVTIIKGLWGRYHPKSSDLVRKSYEDTWAYKYIMPTNAAIQSRLDSPSDKKLTLFNTLSTGSSVYGPIEWYDEKFIHIVTLEGIIRELNPHSVLEVGSGNGFTLNVLSRIFPQVSFNGIELTKSGTLQATLYKNSRSFANEYDSFYPSLTAFQGTDAPNLNLATATAACMPLSDKSIDLVYTCLALEQMKSVQYEVMSEIKRVGARYALFIEPFPDACTSLLQKMRHFSKHYFSVPLGQLTDLGFETIEIERLFLSKPLRPVFAVLCRIRTND